MEKFTNVPNTRKAHNKWLRGSIFCATAGLTAPFLDYPVNCYSHGVLPLQSFVEYLLT